MSASDVSTFPLRISGSNNAVKYHIAKFPALLREKDATTGQMRTVYIPPKLKPSAHAYWTLNRVSTEVAAEHKISAQVFRRRMRPSDTFKIAMKRKTGSDVPPEANTSFNAIPEQDANSDYALLIQDPETKLFSVHLVDMFRMEPDLNFKPRTSDEIERLIGKKKQALVEQMSQYEHLKALEKRKDVESDEELFQDNDEGDDAGGKPRGASSSSKSRGGRGGGRRAQDAELDADPVNERDDLRVTGGDAYTEDDGEHRLEENADDDFDLQDDTGDQAVDGWEFDDDDTGMNEEEVAAEQAQYVMPKDIQGIAAQHDIFEGLDGGELDLTTALQMPTTIDEDSYTRVMQNAEQGTTRRKQRTMVDFLLSEQQDLNASIDDEEEEDDDSDVGSDMDDLVDDTGTATETRASLKRSVDDSTEVPSQGDAKRAKVEPAAPAMAMELDRGMITENELRQAFATRPTISTNELVAVFHSRIEGRLPQFRELLQRVCRKTDDTWTLREYRG